MLWEKKRDTWNRRKSKSTCLIQEKTLREDGRKNQGGEWKVPRMIASNKENLKSFFTNLISDVNKTIKIIGFLLKNSRKNFSSIQFLKLLFLLLSKLAYCALFREKSYVKFRVPKECALLVLRIQPFFFNSRKFKARGFCLFFVCCSAPNFVDVFFFFFMAYYEVLREKKANKSLDSSGVAVEKLYASIKFLQPRAALLTSESLEISREEWFDLKKSRAKKKKKGLLGYVRAIIMWRNEV